MTEHPGRAVVITCSTRASKGIYPDRGGPLLVEALRSLGFDCDDPVVVPDGPLVEASLRDAVAIGASVVITTGGTGLSPTDGTPEATRSVIDREVPGIAEAIRVAGVAQGIPTAMLSRGIAGVAGRTLIVNVPGSSGGVRDALRVLEPVLLHAVSQIAGGDH
ncbi:MAG: MogA/MoaB family molybdenum cofactor biosynthesis protein [Actinomycetales bacterium]|nr:MogA/MoaB family molybdenum cofactor biosynthesis protein [Tetrasphaera sp.]NLW99683.1 MogA/MoaB family molybdenum cofactor biosynthesis protein [Actinomycetales bacterium]